jgi:cytochrome c-type biogenesis protein CcmH/NrfG
VSFLQKTLGGEVESSGKKHQRSIMQGISKALVSVTLTVTLGALAPSALTQTTARSSTLTVVSEPGATVWVDGIRFGKTDPSGRILIKDLGGARHTVMVRSDGFREASKAIASARGDVKIGLVKTTDLAELAFQDAERLVSQDRGQAAVAYRKAISLRPTYAAAYIGLARVLSDSGDYDGALKAIRDLRRTAPQNAEAAAVEGRIYRENGDDEKAIAAFKRAIVIGHGFQPEAYTGLGLLYKERAESAGAAGNFAEETADYNEATKDLTAALKQLSGAPDAVVLYQLLGLVYERQKKFTEALRVYNEFLARFPDSSEASAVRSFIEQIKKQTP